MKCLRYCKVNNKYIKRNNNNNNNNNSKPSKYIMYLNANNLCGWALSQYLSYKEFKWLNKK